MAEVEVELLEDDTGWSPYLSVEDAYKLDDIKGRYSSRKFGVGGKIRTNLRTPSGSASIMAADVLVST